MPKKKKGGKSIKRRKVVDVNKVKIQKAFSNHKAGNLQQAELLYKEVLAADPDNVDANHLYGLLSRQSGKSEIAVTYIEKALSITPNFPEALTNLGNAYQDLDQFEKAIDCYKKALSLNPNHASALRNIKIAYQILGMPEKATPSL